MSEAITVSSPATIVGSKAQRPKKQPKNQKPNPQTKRRVKGKKKKVRNSNFLMNLPSVPSPVKVNENFGVRKSVDYLKTLMNPGSYQSRIPDSSVIPTALYMSRTVVPVVAQLSQDNGRFTAIINPKIGDPSLEVSASQTLLWRGNTSSTNFSNLDSFNSKYLVDPNYRTLTQTNIYQTTIYFNVPCRTGSAPDVLISPTFTSRGGDAAQFPYVPQGSPGIGGFDAPIGNEIIMQTGCYYHDITLTFQKNNQYYSFSTEQMHKYAAIPSVTTPTLGFTMFLYSHTRMSNSLTIVGQLRVAFDNANSGTGTYYVISDGGFDKYIRYVDGQFNVATGLGSNANNDYSTVINLRFYSNLPTITDTSWALGFAVNPPTVVDPTVSLRMIWDITSSTLSDAFPSSSGVINKIRPVAMSALFKCILSDLTNGGAVISAVLNGQDTSQNFLSDDGYNRSSFEQLSTLALPASLQMQKLQDGAYMFWRPDNLNDTLLRPLAEHNMYNFPNFIISGNASNIPDSPTVVAEIEIIRLFEYTTNVTLIPTERYVGLDSFAQATWAELSSYPLVMENPEHEKLLPKLIKQGAKGIAGMMGIPASLVDSLLGLVI